MVGLLGSVQVERLGLEARQEAVKKRCQRIKGRGREEEIAPADGVGEIIGDDGRGLKGKQE